MHFEEGAAQEVVTLRWCAVYDADTLQVLHIQRLVALGELSVDAAGELEALALENASRFFPGHRLAVMHPDVADLDPSAIQDIDPDTMTLRTAGGRIGDQLVDDDG